MTFFHLQDLSSANSNMNVIYDKLEGTFKKMSKSNFCFEKVFEKFIREFFIQVFSSAQDGNPDKRRLFFIKINGIR